MEYAIDKDGNRIHYSIAKKGRSIIYRCPDCFERVFVRGGLKPCFYHTPIHDRTPLQRTCPEYHENNSYKKIEDELDVLYINNGGIPLYLCNNEERFQLRAYFPRISEKSYNKLKQMGVKIHVNSKSISEVDRRTYSIENLDFYPVNTIEKWIDVTCEPAVYDEEVQRKWLWGIRGVDIEKDIYYCNKDGGYRVALKANISVGKMYRIMFDRYPPKVEGIDFHNVGRIYLKKGLIYKNIDIYEMNVYRFTEDARKFIEGKGYRLVEKSDELLPLWPPGVFKGNEIIFDKHEVLFLYIRNSEKRRLYHTLHNRLFKIYHSEGKNSVIPLQINDNKSVIISDEEKETSNYEIKYSIQYTSSLVQKQELKPELIIKDSYDREVNFNEKNLVPPKDGKLYISSNVPFCATVNNKNYVIYSSNTCFENVNYLWDLIIDSGAFGIKRYTYKREKVKDVKYDNIDWELEYLRLYRCTLPTIAVSNRYFRLLYLLSQNINENNIQLYRLLDNWIKTNSIPVSAVRYLDQILKCLGEAANE